MGKLKDCNKCYHREHPGTCAFCPPDKSTFTDEEEFNKKMKELGVD